MHADLAKAGNRFIFFWNLDGAVGLNGVNETMDVLFVSWCFFILAQQSILSTAMKKTFNDIGLTGICSGREGDPLITAIKLYQTEVKRVVDGRVSPARGISFNYEGAKQRYTIIRLNDDLRRIYPNQFPRLDKVPQFAWRLAPLVRATFEG